MADLSKQYLLFNLEETNMGFPLECIKLVLRAAELMKVPTTSGGPIGLLDMRGEMVPVYDLRTLMRMPSATLSPDHHFIVATPGGHKEAFLVDDIDEVVDFTESRIETPDRSNLPPFVDGMVRHDSMLILCLSEKQISERNRPSN